MHVNDAFHTKQKHSALNSSSKAGGNVWLACRKQVAIEVLCGLWKDQPLLCQEGQQQWYLWLASGRKVRRRPISGVRLWNGLDSERKTCEELKWSHPNGGFLEVGQSVLVEVSESAPSALPPLSVVCASQEHLCALVSKEAWGLWAMNTTGISMQFGLKNAII